MPKTETPAEKLERKSRQETGRAPAGSPKDRAGAKRPQDYRKPAPKPDKDGMLNVTVDDVTVTVDTNGMRDWRFVEASGAVEAGAAGAAEIFQVVALVIPDRADRAHVRYEEATALDTVRHIRVEAEEDGCDRIRGHSK